jgi:hypothetical protein
MTLNQCKKKRPFNLRLLIIAKEFFKYEFPNIENYDHSIWSTMESRITEGHKREEQLSAADIKKIEEQLTPTDKELMSEDDMLDMFADSICFPTEKVSNIMYASLIVSLWARVENNLKRLLWLCKKANNPDEKVSLQRCHIIRIIKEGFLKEVNIKLEEQPNYSIVNAVRILCNCFKHSEGFYIPEGCELYEQIESDLLTKWQCISNHFKESKAIEYDKLPIQELVFACKDFIDGLFGQIEEKLVNRPIQ